MSQAELSARDSLPGTVLDERYHIDELLAEGGMGCVYRAYDAIEECVVAVKVLRAHLAMDEAMHRRFIKEARATMSIVSENVVEIIAHGELDDGSAFYVMEYLDGWTLDEYRVDTLETLKAIALQVCAGLAAAHAQGVVHRDLKPENVIVAEMDDGAPYCRLIDFGIAKLPFATMLTVPGQILGTPAYIAPEQAKAGRAVDHRCDIYALGVVLFELVSGSLPFEHDDPICLALAHLTAPPPPIAERVPSCPPDLAALIMRCLKKNPAERFPDVPTLVAALEKMPLRGAIGQAAPERVSGCAFTPTPELETTVLYEDPGIDCSKMVVVDRRALPISVSDLLAVKSSRERRTPPPPEPWICADAMALPAPHQEVAADWLLWLVVSAALTLAVAAVAVTSWL